MGNEQNIITVYLEKILKILNGSLSTLISCLEAGNVSLRNVLYFHWEEIQSEDEILSDGKLTTLCLIYYIAATYLYIPPGNRKSTHFAFTFTIFEFLN